MRKIALNVIALILFLCSSYGQSFQNLPRDSARLSKLPKRYIPFKLKAVDSTKLQLPFNNIYFKDVRFDTSCIAVQYGPKKQLEKITLNDFSTSVQNHFKSSGLFAFDTEKNDLICFVRKMRFTDLDSIGKDYVNNRNSLNTKVILDVEGFLKVDSLFYPAIKLDTIFIAHIEASMEGRQGLLSEILYSFALKASRLKEDMVKKKHAYIFDELESRYAKRTELPILKDTALNKGLYLSFKEFINNNPSVKDFEIADGRQKTITIKNEDGTSEVTRNAFGYCDGKYIWIQASNNFFPLFKEQSSLHFWVTVDRKKTSSVPYFYSIQNGIIYSSAAALGALAINALVRPETTDYIYPYYLDLENGEIY